MLAAGHVQHCEHVFFCLNKMFHTIKLQQSSKVIVDSDYINIFN